MLALNALFILMKDYNLFVSRVFASYDRNDPDSAGTILNSTHGCTHSWTGISCTQNTVLASSDFWSFS